jgi:hypothetical protein
MTPLKNTAHIAGLQCLMFNQLCQSLPVPRMRSISLANVPALLNV